MSSFLRAFSFAALLFVVPHPAYSQAPFTDPQYPGWVYYPYHGWVYQPQYQPQQFAQPAAPGNSALHSENFHLVQGTATVDRRNLQSGTSSPPQRVERFLPDLNLIQVLLYYPDQNYYQLLGYYRR